jgi:DNA repair protein RecO (recombination protein O)
MIKKIEGIVIREKSYRETSKIITVLTKEDGLLNFIAKGAKSLKSDLRQGTTKLTSGIFQVYFKEDGLSTLTSVDILSSFKNIKKDIEKISYASFLL